MGHRRGTPITPERSQEMYRQLYQENRELTARVRELEAALAQRDVEAYHRKRTEPVAAQHSGETAVL